MSSGRNTEREKLKSGHGLLSKLKISNILGQKKSEEDLGRPAGSRNTSSGHHNRHPRQARRYPPHHNHHNHHHRSGGRSKTSVVQEKTRHSSSEQPSRHKASPDTDDEADDHSDWSTSAQNLGSQGQSRASLPAPADDQALNLHAADLCLSQTWSAHTKSHEDSESHEGCELTSADSIFTRVSNRISFLEYQSWIVRQGQRANGAGWENVRLGLDLMTAIARAHPISGLVFGVFKATVDLISALGKQYTELTGALKTIDETIQILAICDQKRLGDKIDENIIGAYTLILDFVCSANVFLLKQKTGERDVLRWTEKVKNVASDLDRPMKALDRQYLVSAAHGIQDVKNDQLKEHTRKCLDDLRDTGGKLDLNRLIDKPAEGTCEWMTRQTHNLSAPAPPRAWRHWRDGLKSEMLLVTGDIGTGKSVFASATAKALESLPGEASQRAVCIFHCKNDKVHNTALAALRGLLYRLANKSPAVSDLLTEKWIGEVNNKRHPAELFQSLESVEKIFTECLGVCSTPIFIIVDGLDECERKSWQSVFQFFNNVVKSTLNVPAKVLLVARPETDILRTIQDENGVERFELRRVQDRNDEMNHIITHYVMEFVRDKNYQSDVDVLSDTLKEHADGSALWVRLFVENLPSISSVDVLKIYLDGLGSEGYGDLDSLYSALIRKKYPNKVDLKFATDALRMIAGAARPMTVQEIAFAMVTVYDRKNLQKFSDMEKLSEVTRVSNLLPFVRIADPGSTIHLVHASLKEWIENLPPQDWTATGKVERKPQSKEINALLTTVCLKFLTLPPFCKGKYFGLPMDSSIIGRHQRFFEYDVLWKDDDNATEEWDAGFYEYAALFWGTHAAVTDMSDDMVDMARLLSEPHSRQGSNWWTSYRRLSAGIWEEADLALECDPMITAGVLGLKDMAESIFNRGFPVTDLSLEQAKSLAARNGHVLFVEFLFEKGKASAEDLEECLYLALTSGLPKLVEEFLDEPGDGYRNGVKIPTWKVLVGTAERGLTSLFDRLYKREPESRLSTEGIDLVVAALSNLNNPDPKYNHDRKLSILERLLQDKRIDVKARFSRDNATLLHRIARADCKPALDLLLKHRSKQEKAFLLSDQLDKWGNKALSIAIRWADLDFIDALLQQDAIAPQLLSRDARGNTVLSLAVKRDERTVKMIIDCVPTEYLDAPNERGETPLGLVHWNMNDDEAVAIVRALLATNAVDVESRSDDGTTPLQKALAWERISLCRVLILEGGADVESRSGDGTTPLQKAVMRDRIALCRVLILEGGADWSKVLELPQDETGTPKLLIECVKTSATKYIAQDLADIVKEATQGQKKDERKVTSSS